LDIFSESFHGSLKTLWRATFWPAGCYLPNPVLDQVYNNHLYNKTSISHADVMLAFVMCLI